MRLVHETKNSLKCINVAYFAKTSNFRQKAPIYCYRYADGTVLRHRMLHMVRNAVSGIDMQS